MALVNKEQVKSVLPHRAPFLFIDEVLELQPSTDSPTDMKSLIGSTVVATFKVEESLEILKGHFPGNPVYPGVIHVEMMAQASAFIALLLPNMSIDNLKLDTKLLGVDKARFRKLISPGMELRIESTLTRIRGQFNTYSSQVFDSENELVSQCEILAMIDFL